MTSSWQLRLTHLLLNPDAEAEMGNNLSPAQAVAGRKTLKHVPVLPLVELTTSSLPSILSIMLLVTQSPIPVPLSPLVVKKGSKILSRFSAGIPQPVSATLTAISE